LMGLLVPIAFNSGGTYMNKANCYPFTTEMRKGFYTLSGLVNVHMRQDVKKWRFLYFYQPPLISLKALHMESDGCKFP
ncbi:MAG: hypothetical protein PHR52_13560, partial [Fermentimonas sp.]|nr:hypothetical protein [Fermentimonas sp.]